MTNISTVSWTFSDRPSYMTSDFQMDRPVDYYSPDFIKILLIINEVLGLIEPDALSYSSSPITKSMYDKVAQVDSCLMWRVTDATCPALKQLCNPQTKNMLSAAIRRVFPTYLGSVVKINTYGLNTKASIVIMPCGLSDNMWTAHDLYNYQTDSAVRARLDEIESRMFKRAGDTRTSEMRWDNYKQADFSERALLNTPLERIHNLAASHSLLYYSLEPQSLPDFTGEVDGATCELECKSKRGGFDYTNTDVGKREFAVTWEHLKTNLGSFHKASFVLLVDMQDGKVICIDVTQPQNNWLAGYINMDMWDRGTQFYE